MCSGEYVATCLWLPRSKHCDRCRHFTHCVLILRAMRIKVSKSIQTFFKLYQNMYPKLGPQSMRIKVSKSIQTIASSSDCWLEFILILHLSNSTKYVPPIHAYQCEPLQYPSQMNP